MIRNNETCLEEKKHFTVQRLSQNNLLYRIYYFSPTYLKKICRRVEFVLLAMGRINLVITKSNNKKEARIWNRGKIKEGTFSYSPRFCTRDETT